MADFLITHDARNDLDSIWHFIAKDNPKAANRVEDEIIEMIHKIAERPYIGHMRDDLTDKDVRFVSIYSYMIIYKPKPEPITVLRILSSYRNLHDLI